jgi:hypothetical protein
VFWVTTKKFQLFDYTTEFFFGGDQIFSITQFGDQKFWWQDLETKNWQPKIFGHLIQHHKISIVKKVVDVHFGR